MAITLDSTKQKRDSTPTVTVYQYDEKLREHLTRVTCVRGISDLSPEEQALFKNGTENTRVVETAETIFYVQGGGQPFDTGHMTAGGESEKEKFIVQAVRYGKEGRVLHFGYFTGQEDTAPFEDSDMVYQKIDGSRRDMNSRIHSAGHVLGLAVRRLAEKTPELEVTELKAQHYPDASFVEFRGIIDGKYKDVIQTASSQYLTDALPVKLYWYKPEELGEKGVITPEGMPMVADRDGKVRVVDIVGAGAYPCGGTHVPDTSFIGTMTLKNIKRQKGVSKISYTVTDGQG